LALKPPQAWPHGSPKPAAPRPREPKWNPFVVAPCNGPDRPLALFYNRFCIAPELGKKDRTMSALIGILITFLVIILVLYLVNMLPIEGRAKHIVRIIVIIIGILSLLKYLGVWF
jgi:hypothetical protein